MKDRIELLDLMDDFRARLDGFLVLLRGRPAYVELCVRIVSGAATEMDVKLTERFRDQRPPGRSR
jgi:hypothetical protein